MPGGFFQMVCRVKRPRAWRCRKRARPCLEKSPGVFLNWPKHKQILKARNTQISKLQPKNRQDRACRIELAELGLIFHRAKSVLPPASVAFLRKITCHLRYPMGLRHSYTKPDTYIYTYTYVYIYIYTYTFVYTYNPAHSHTHALSLFPFLSHVQVTVYVTCTDADGHSSTTELRFVCSKYPSNAVMPTAPRIGLCVCACLCVCVYIYMHLNMCEYVHIVTYVYTYSNIPPINWFWLPIFPTNLVRGLSNKAMKFQNKGAVPVQIAPLLISQPRNQNQSILSCPQPPE